MSKTLIYLAVIVSLTVSMGLAPAFADPADLYAYGLHFVYIVLYFRQTSAPIETVTVIFDGLAYVLFWMMAAISNNFSMRFMGRWRKRLHTFGMHHIWLIFAQS